MHTRQHIQILCEMKTFIIDIFSWVKESENKGNVFLRNDLWNSVP